MNAFMKLVCVILACSRTLDCYGQFDSASGDINLLEYRLDEQAAEIAALRQKLNFNERSSEGTDRQRHSILLSSSETPSTPFVTEHKVDFFAGYENGFFIRTFEPAKNSFELKINSWIQFRHHGFVRDVESWTDSAGVTRPVENRNAFDIERARLTFAGYALDSRLTYFLQLDGDTDGTHAVDFFDYWWAFKFTDFLKVQIGKRKVPASRQWLLGARRTRFIDRPMVNDFFRPDRTIGIFALGEIGQTGQYEVMIGNGYRTTNLPNSMTDDQFTFAATNYFDPLGNFGGNIVDFQVSDDPLIRFGHSFVFSPQTANSNGAPLAEADFIRLSDGTILTQTGALAPGVTVSSFDVYFYGVDVALKWRGFSINSEVFFQWIEDINGDGTLPVHSIFRYGFYTEGGYFLIRELLDVNVRYSRLSGEFGDSQECAIGLNWYPFGTHKCKISFDVTSLDGSPLQNRSSDILAGDDGVLLRTQFQAEF